MKPDTALRRLKDEGFSLALSGGGALGCAHLGVLRFLEERSLSPKEIVGTSMGSILGAALACGLTCDQMAEFFRRFAKVTKWVEFTWSKPALFKTEKLSAIFEELFEGRMLNETEIPLKVAATDFDNGRKRIFSGEDGIPLKDALLCSMAIPVLFPPVIVEGRPYVDGFLSAHLPVAEVSDASKPVVAVDVMSEETLQPLSTSSSFFKKAKTLLDTYERAFFLLVQNQTREVLSRIKNVYCLKPPLAGSRFHQFDEWERLMEVGFKEAERFFIE